MNKKFQFTTSVLPYFNRGVFWYGITFSIVVLMFYYLLFVERSFFSTLCILSAIIFYIYNYRTNNKPHRVCFTDTYVQLRDKRVSYKEIRSFTLLKNGKKPMLLCLNFTGISKSIPVPKKYEVSIRTFLKKKIKYSSNPYLLDKLCYIFKL